MNILPYSVDLQSEWARFVDTHPHRAIGHLPAIATLEQLTSGARNRSLVVRDEAGRLVGVIPLFECERCELRLFRTRVLCSGTHVPSGPLLATSLSERQLLGVTEQIATRLVAEAREIRADAIEIAYPTVVGDRPAVENMGLYPLRPFGFHETNVVALVADLSVSEGELMTKLDAKARNLIKRCLKGGAEVRPILAREEWLRCHELNQATLGAHAYSKEAFAAIWDVIIAPGHAAAVGTYFEGRLVSVVTVTLVGSSSYYWLSFNSAPPPIPGANTLALWEGMLTARRSGRALFELGSLEFDNPKQIRIGKFKAQFGGRPVYALAGVRQLRPIRRATLDLIAQLARSLPRRRRAPREAPDSVKE